MIHLGDISKISGYDVPIVDIVTGGSPCQDLSVAGKREGLKGERSGLFMELSDLDSWSGKTYPELSAQTKATTSKPSSKKRQKSQTKMPLYLNLQKTGTENSNGVRQDASWEMGGALLGEYTMRSFGECPSEEKESLLLQILEDKPHPKYCLSAKACQGILRRAEKRGKTLPPMLKEALERQASIRANAGDNQQAVVYGISAYDSNAMKSSNPNSGIYEADTSCKHERV